MSGGIPKKVWQGKMRTKTNQTGMKMSGNPSIIGRKNINKRYIGTRNGYIIRCKRCDKQSLRLQSTNGNEKHSAKEHFAKTRPVQQMA